MAARKRLAAAKRNILMSFLLMLLNSVDGDASLDVV
jgi:hypothetical protein